MTGNQGEAVGSPAAGSMAGQMAFWRRELPKLGYEFNLKTLYMPIFPCPICRGARSYRPEGAARKVACFCRLQAHYQKRIAHWQDYDFLPEPYQNIKREELLALERILTPTQRVQFSLLLKDVDRFIRNPKGNRIFIGGVGSHCSMLAAYIAESLVPLPNFFITLRRLADLLGAPETADDDRLRGLFFDIPVLLVDDFSSAYSRLDEVSAQRLFDLVDYRQAEGLPIIIVSDVELDQLWSIHPSLLDRLQQDAEAYAFDCRQIRLRRPAGRSTGRLRPDDPRPQAHRCPWLGVDGAADAAGIFPMSGHCCLRVSTPQPIALAYQAGCCLSANYVTCPAFQAPEGRRIDALPRDILPPEASPARAVQPLLPPAALLIIVGVILVAVVGGLMVFSELSQPPVPISTPRPTITGIPIAMPSSTVFPTMTSVSPTAIPAMPVTPSVPVETLLAEDARLRMRPEADAPAFGLLPAGTGLSVLGRDVSGGWLYVEVKDGLVGWVETAAMGGNIDALAMPVYGEITSTPEATAGEADIYPSIVFLTPTSTPGIPNVFTMLLQSMNISSCEHADLSIDYTFRLAGSDITILRSSDGTVLMGNYQPDTGIFRVSATHPIGLEDMNGRLRLVDGWLEVSGEHTLAYFDRECTVVWTLSGRTLARRDR
ncbi:MAG: hypothetical protein JXB07_09600 [Anaerolineae bacterium]|nr:hypothetical protein [Anaerolineae bacterium]